MHDELGNRMKEQYESRTQFLLPRRTYTIVRVDGKAFHTYTRHCNRPFDATLASDMDATGIALCEGMQGACFAFVQSDEISVLLTDFATDQTEAWFDGSMQKIVSISASIATAKFNERRGDWKALFDSRVFTIPDRTEVENYFIWRQNDATRNSIQMAAQAQFSPKQMHHKSCDELQEMLFTEKNINWNDYQDGFKRGRVVVKASGEKDVEFTHKRTKEVMRQTAFRTWWESHDAPWFTKERGWFDRIIPIYK